MKNYELKIRTKSKKYSVLIGPNLIKNISNILKKKNIENYNTSGKIYVSNISKVFQTLLSIYDFILLLLIKSNDHLRDKEHLIIKDEINLNERF